MEYTPTNVTSEEEKQGYRVIEIDLDFGKGGRVTVYHCLKCQYDSEFLNDPNPATMGKHAMGIIPHIKKDRHPWAFIPGEKPAEE